MARHFACTACGKCCRGVVPLTIGEAVRHAGRFPLAVLWQPIPARAKSFDRTRRLGVMLDKKTALRVMPVAYLPADAPCPALDDQGLCTLQGDKPLRCAAMPFYGWRGEADQADLLVPRPGWACDVSGQAPAVYDNGKILDRAAYDAEVGALTDQAAVIAGYAQRLLPMAAGLAQTLAGLATKPRGGEVYLGFAALLRRLPDLDKAVIARAQLSVLAVWADRGDAAYLRNVAGFRAEMERLAASGEGGQT